MALPLIVGQLLASGLSLLGNAVMAKGQEVIEEKLGVDIGTLIQTPEGKIKLMELQMNNEDLLRQFVLAKREQELRSDAMAYEDTADARKLGAELSKSESLLNRNIVPFIGAGVLLITFTMFGILIFGQDDIKQSRQQIVFYILGILSAVCSQIISYYFGSSKGSNMKDETIKTLKETYEPR